MRNLSLLKPGLLTIAFNHSFNLSLAIALGHILALVIQLLAFAQSKLDLYPIRFEV